MGRSSKRTRKVEESDDGSTSGSDELEKDMMLDSENEYVDDDDDDDGDDDDESDNDDEEDKDMVKEEDEDTEEEEEDEKRVAEQKNPEMDELEKEFMDIHQKEQDLLKSLKRHKDEDLLKGQAVKNQMALWDKTLEFRFLLQKAFSSSNRLPQEPDRSLFFDSENGVDHAYSDLIASSKKTLDAILELQKEILEKNPSITQATDGDVVQNTKSLGNSLNLNEEVDEEWMQIAQMHSRMASFRDKAIDKWQRKTQVTTGAAAFKNKLQAFNQNISEQVATYMRDPTKMLKGMQQRRSTVAIFGTVADPNDDTSRQDLNTDGDPELLDDVEFYQQLLREFLETVGPKSSEAPFYYDMKRLQTKKRKIVDRPASKSRKIRYHVHEKIVNFMAPQPVNLPLMAPKLFEDLFGLKSQRLAA